MSKSVIIVTSAHDGYVWINVPGTGELRVGPLAALYFAWRLTCGAVIALLNRIGS